MRGTRRIALLAASGSLLVGAVAATTVPAGAAPAVAAGGAVRIHVHGTLLVAQSDGARSTRSYAVALPDGDLIRVRGPLAHARPLSHFVGQLSLPASVRSGLSTLRGNATLDASSALGRLALQIVDRTSLTLQVTGTPRLTDPKENPTPVAHQQYVAALDNKGTLGQNDSQLLAHVSTVGGYWKHESNGAISQIGVPATVAHYNTALTTTDCGLGDDFFSIVQEAAKQFPGINVFGGSDQLVLFVPPACQTNGVVGEGTVGSSFGSGGALVVEAGTAIEGTYGHETGHNYGFEHSNARRSGISMEYYGVYDVMGFALGGGYNQLTALSTPFRVFQGITDPGEIQRVTVHPKVPLHVTTTIRPRSDDTGLRSVRFVDPDSGEPLYLDYRSGTGQDAGAFYAGGRALGSSGGNVAYAPGVTINAARDGSGVDTLVVDDSGDTSLAPGTTWRNASGRLRVTVDSKTSTGATVTITYRPVLAQLAAPRPTIAGKPQVGRRLTAVPGAWTKGTKLAFTWYADGHVIKHATTRHLVVAHAERGHRIRVAVTGTKVGYHARTVRSAATAKVS